MTIPATSERLPSADGVRFTPTALEVVSDLSFEEFEQIVRRCGRIGDAAKWWLGDLILFGDRRYGEQYAQVLSHARLSEHQVSRYRWVCERIGRSRRRENLSFSHHVEVAPLEPRDQDEILARADRDQLTVAEVREAVRDLRVVAETQRRPAARLQTDAVGAVAGLARAREALGLTFQHLRDVRDGTDTVDVLDVAQAIPPALRAIEQATRTVRRAEERLARPTLLEAARAAVRGATRSSGFAMVPEETFAALEAAVREEEA